MKPKTINELINLMRPGYAYLLDPSGVLHEINQCVTDMGIKLTNRFGQPIIPQRTGFALSSTQATRLIRCHRHHNTGAPPGTFYSANTWYLYKNLIKYLAKTSQTI